MYKPSQFTDEILFVLIKLAPVTDPPEPAPIIVFAVIVPALILPALMLPVYVVNSAITLDATLAFV